MKNLSELDPQNFPKDWLDHKDNGLLVMEIIIGRGGEESEFFVPPA